MDSSKINSIIEKSQSLLLEKKFYEYEQKIKTLSTRYSSTNKHYEAVFLLVKASKNLLEHNEANAGFELSNLALTIIEKEKLEISNELKNDLIQLLKITKFDIQKLRYCNNLLNRVLINNNTEVYEIMGNELLDNKIYYIAQKFLLQTNNTASSIKLLREWVEISDPKEKDLFIFRYVLLKICAKKIDEANFLLLNFKNEISESPLYNLGIFLMKAIQIKSKTAFKRLIEIYEPSFNRDPAFSLLLKQIGIIFFGFQDSSAQNPLSSMIKFLFE